MAASIPAAHASCGDGGGSENFIYTIYETKSKKASLNRFIWLFLSWSESDNYVGGANLRLINLDFFLASFAVRL